MREDSGQVGGLDPTLELGQVLAPWQEELLLLARLDCTQSNRSTALIHAFKLLAALAPFKTGVARGSD
jgi:hypothetical protein